MGNPPETAGTPFKRTTVQTRVTAVGDTVNNGSVDKSSEATHDETCRVASLEPQARL